MRKARGAEGNNNRKNRLAAVLPAVVAVILLAWRNSKSGSTPRQRAPIMPGGHQGTALITGASSGIGEVFARRLARSGYDLVLVARRRELLEILEGELRTSYQTDAEVLVSDLTETDGLKAVEERIAKTENLALLINNAGFAIEGRFADVDIEGQLEMVGVHDVASMVLTRAALPGMIARKRGDIINVSSMGALFPFPGNTTYNATKAFLVAFTESLHLELEGTGLRIQVLCPGFTRTGFHDAMGVDISTIPSYAWMQPEEVVDGSLRALRHGKVVYIPGIKNRLLTLFFRLPRPILYWMMKRLAGI